MTEITRVSNQAAIMQSADLNDVERLASNHLSNQSHSRIAPRIQRVTQEKKDATEEGRGRRDEVSEAWGREESG